MISAFLDSFAGLHSSAVWVFICSLVIFSGTGNLLLHWLKLACPSFAFRFNTSLSLGFVVSAFFLALGAEAGHGLFGAVALLLKVAGIVGFWFMVKDADFFRFLARRNYWSPFPLFPLLILLGLLIGSIGAFQYPASWDECVYQLAVPVRWVADGRPHFYADLPYSGFPMLPQFIWMFAIASGGGLAAVKLLIFCMTASFFIQLYLLMATPRTRPAAGIFVLSFLFAPVMLHVLISGYAEPVQACLTASALSLLQKKGISRQTMLLTGILAGGIASIKLTGAFSAAAVLFYAFLCANKKLRLSQFAVFVASAVMVALPFYLRSWILTGSPCYPYFAGLFGAPSAEVSTFHKLLGTSKFASRSIPTLILLLPGLAFPAISDMFDGVYGLQLILWLIPLLIAFSMRFRRCEKILIPLFPLLFLVVCWFLSSRQARFLLPALVFLALSLHNSTPAMLRAGKHFRFFFLAAVVMAAAMAIPRSVPSAYASNLRAMIHQGMDGKRDILFGRTGDSMLPLAELLRTSPLKDIPGKCLLILEERTLYLPSGRCEIGTPCFQDKYFPSGVIPSKDDLYDMLVRQDISMVFLRMPENNPDYLPQYSDVWFPVLWDALSRLVKEDKLTAQALPGPALLYIRRDCLPASPAK